MSRLRHVAFFSPGLLICAAGPSAAQETRATINGRVTDPSGAVVPGAKVAVLNKSMGTRVVLSTNESGLYEAPLLIPGQFQVAVEAGGFRKSIQDAIELRVGDRLEVNVKLEIGSTDQSITITTETEQLTTESGQILLPADQLTTSRYFNTSAGFVTAANAQPVANLRAFPLRWAPSAVGPRPR
jgi:hypothetical protein